MMSEDIMPEAVMQAFIAEVCKMYSIDVSKISMDVLKSMYDTATEQHSRDKALDAMYMAMHNYVDDPTTSVTFYDFFGGDEDTVTDKYIYDEDFDNYNTKYKEGDGYSVENDNDNDDDVEEHNEGD